MMAPFILNGIGSNQGKWTMKDISSTLSVVHVKEDKQLPSPEEEMLAIESWKAKIPEGFYPSLTFNPLIDGDVNECGFTKVLFCPELMMDIGCLAEDAFRLLDTHGFTKQWQQWKVRNAMVSITMASSILAALAIGNPSLMQAPFELGNCLPRSILYPFTGREGKGCHHMIKDECLPTDYNASSFNTLAFIERSEQMSPKERWSNGNVSAEYLRVHERVSNITETSKTYDSATGKWHEDKIWVSKKNLYSATPKLKRLVSAARMERLHFIEVDCHILKKWFIECYVDHGTGKLRKGARINARKDFPDVWKKWTGLKDIDGKFIQCSTFSKAMNAYGEDILSGRLAWVSHLEKILRGLFIGDENGMTLSEIVKREQKPAVISIAKMSSESPSLPDIGKNELHINVEFDPNAVQNVLDKKRNSLEKHVAGQLQSFLFNGKEDDGKNWIRLHFLRRRHGRFYGYGNSVQLFPKWLRKEVFPAYASVDLNCGVYSLMVSQLQEHGYDGDISEMQEMTCNKDAYRRSLVDPSLHISLDNVKKFLTMIGYGCTLDVAKIVDAAEWKWLVEVYSIEQTMYDSYKHSPGTALAGGIDDPDRLMQIAKWAANPKVFGLWKEMQEGGRFLFSRMTAMRNGRPTLRNAWGEELDVKSKRISFGKKLAHIYQGAESMLLWKIMDGFEVGGMPVKNSMFGFGIPMHDGFGLHKEVVGSNSAHLVEQYVSNAVGWNLKYDCE